MSCKHDWKIYESLISVDNNFEYCAVTGCDVKKSDWERLEQTPTIVVGHDSRSEVPWWAQSDHSDQLHKTADALNECLRTHRVLPTTGHDWNASTATRSKCGMTSMTAGSDAAQTCQYEQLELLGLEAWLPKNGPQTDEQWTVMESNWKKAYAEAIERIGKAQSEAAVSGIYTKHTQENVDE